MPVVTRGLLLDMCACKGVNMLGPKEEITKEDLKDCLKREKLKIEPGDVILFYTGWSQMIGRDAKAFASTEPGPGIGAITMNGVYILENLHLSELAKDKVYQFCLIMTAPKMRGMVQAILQPIAIN